MRKGLSYQYNRCFASTSHSSFGEAESIFPSRFQRTFLALFTATILLLPFISNEYICYLLNLWLVQLIAALGLNILTGYTGLLSLGHGAFMGVGAYTMALLVERAGFPILAALPLCGAVAALFGVLIGVPSLRIKGFYLMVATIALGRRWRNMMVRLETPSARAAWIYSKLRPRRNSARTRPTSDTQENSSRIPSSTKKPGTSTEEMIKRR